MLKRSDRVRIFTYLILLLLALFQLYRQVLYGAPIVKVLEAPLPPFHGRTHIAHALGSVNSIPYTNSWPAFLESYEKGLRVFEVDLELLNDGTLVCFHIGSEEAVSVSQSIRLLSKDQFLALRYNGEIPTLEARSLFERLESYPDVELILDTKGNFAETITQTLRHSREVSPSLTSRMVPQIYGNGSDELRIVLAEESFRYILYSLYKGSGTERRVLDFLRLNKVSGIVAPVGSRSNDFIAELRALNIPLFVHSVSDQKTADQLLSRGITGVFTFNLAPAG